jgi:Asp-tRNA(Asn)/Glu-tRNA(Gln) amidotransferase A subunit family amidase
MAADLHWMTARALGPMFRRRACSPREVTDALLARIAALDPSLCAYVRVDAGGRAPPRAGRKTSCGRAPIAVRCTAFR